MEHKTEKIGNALLCPQYPMRKCCLCSEENKGCPALEIKCLDDCPACAVEKYRKDVLEKIKAIKDELKIAYDFCWENTKSVNDAWDLEGLKIISPLTKFNELIKELEAEK